MKTPVEREPDRVRRHTTAPVLEAIDERIENNVRGYSAATPARISQRIDELEREWDMERVLETNASILALSGTMLGLVLDRRWLVLPGAVLGFLLQHALTGWCPPVPIFRRAGIRTRGEIDREKFALKVLRGDFQDVSPNPPAAAPWSILKAVNS